MKTIKKVFALLLTVVMVLGLSVTAFADTTTTGSITVKNAAANETYTAYKIFDVTYNTDKTAYSYTISIDSKWLDTIITYMGYTKSDGNWYTKVDKSIVTSPKDGVTYYTDNDGIYTEATNLSSWDNDTTYYTKADKTFEGSGLTLELSDTGEEYVVTATTEGETNTFSAADFAEALYAALNGYTVVASDASFVSGTTYYTYNSGTKKYEKCTDLSAFEDGTTYYTKDLGIDGTELTYDSTTKTASVSGLALGYYFVTSSVGSLANLTTTNPNVTIFDKNEQPPFKKEADDVDVEIGQTVNYTITGEVPSTTGYESYTYKVTDTLSDGLTFNKDVKVYIGTLSYDDDGNITNTAVTLTTVTASANSETDVTTYTIGSGEGAKKVYSKTVENKTTYYSEEGCTTEVENQSLPFGDATILYTDNGFELYFDMFKHQDDVDKAITITYSAVVNEKADVTDGGNKNTATLEYSNDPNDSTRKATETDEVKVYTVDLTIDKYAGGQTVDSYTYTDGENTVTVYSKDGTTYYEDANLTKKATLPEGTTPTKGGAVETTSVKLSGAEFVLVKKTTEGEGDNATIKETFYQAVYAYTYTDSNSNTVTVYSANGTTYYSDMELKTSVTLDDNTETTKGKVVNVIWVSDSANATVVTTDPNGAATFDGLEQGTYYLRETEAPKGYNKLTTDVEVKITRGTDESNNVTISGNTTEVANSTGAELPSTGGIGTTIFYVVGSILVIGAAILLITKRRMNGKEK